MYLQCLPGETTQERELELLCASKNNPVPLHNPNIALSTVPGGALSKRKCPAKEQIDRLHQYILMLAHP